MARINDPKISAQIAEMASRETIDTSDIIATLNQALPPGQQVKQSRDITTGMYKEFSDFDKIDAKVEMVTTGMWDGGESTMTDFNNTSGSGEEWKNFYVNVYFDGGEGAEPQFAISYGHIDGGGSALIEDDDNAQEASKVTYLQYRSMLLPPGQEKFEINDTEVDDVYIININRNRYRERVDPGNWTINIDDTEYIDDSGRALGVEYGSIKSVYNIYEVDETGDTTGNPVGLFYPNHGIMIFDTSVTTTSGSPDDTAGKEDKNFNILRDAIGEFTARRLENISTQHFFVRATNREFNYSNNPTFVKSDGKFKHRSFESDPKTYITTVGLYNNSNEMVAVAKTSQPIEKSFSKETLIKVRLAF